MDKYIIIAGLIYLFGVFISSISQILLKKSTQKTYKNWIREYLNVRVIVAYVIFFSATLCSVLAYKYLPLSMGPIIGATEYIFIALLSFFFLKEKMGKKKILGLLLIVVGVIIFAI